MEPATACWVLQKYCDYLPGSGSALDLACGLGGNSLDLAQRGLKTYAWDISDTALQHLEHTARTQKLTVLTRQCDLLDQPFSTDKYDVIVVSHFLERGLFAQIKSALLPGGLVYYQTFVKTDMPASGPSRPEWRLDKDELLDVFRDLEILAYHEDHSERHPGINNSGLAAIVARKII